MAENQLKGKLFGVHRHQTIKASINASHMNQMTRHQFGKIKLGSFHFGIIKAVFALQ